MFIFSTFYISLRYICIFAAVGFDALRVALLRYITSRKVATSISTDMNNTPDSMLVTLIRVLLAALALSVVPIQISRSF